MGVVSRATIGAFLLLDLTKPEILVYQPTPGGGLRLGAVAYLAADGGDRYFATDPPAVPRVHCPETGGHDHDADH